MPHRTFYIVVTAPAQQTADILRTLVTTWRKARAQARDADITALAGKHDRVEVWTHTELRRRHRNGWEIVDT